MNRRSFLKIIGASVGTVLISTPKLRAKKKSEWISFKENLPKKGQKLIMAYQLDSEHHSEFYKDYKHFYMGEFISSDEKYIKFVCHLSYNYWGHNNTCFVAYPSWKNNVSKKDMQNLKWLNSSLKVGKWHFKEYDGFEQTTCTINRYWLPISDLDKIPKYLPKLPF